VIDGSEKRGKGNSLSKTSRNLADSRAPSSSSSRCERSQKSQAERTRLYKLLWRGYYFKSQRERERKRKKGVHSSFSRVDDLHRLRERSKSLILQDESRSSFCRTIHSSTESSKLTSGTGSTFEVDETEYLFRYSYCDERVDRFVTSCHHRARRESV